MSNKRELAKIAKEIKEIKEQVFDKKSASLLDEGSWYKNLTPEQIAKALVKHMGSGYNYEVSHGRHNSIAYIESEEVMSHDYGENYLIVTTRSSYPYASVEAYVENAGGVTHGWDLSDYDNFDKAMKDIARRSKRFL